jgi:hypothetical protein
VRRLALLLLPVGLALILPSTAQEAAPADPFRGVARPFLERHCTRCHDAKERAGELDLAAFADAAAVADAPDVWTKVLDKVTQGEMPPEDEPRPSAEEVRAFAAWIKQTTGRAAASGPIDPGRVTVRRLNRAEYTYTIQDLLRVPLRPGDELPVDDVGYGFDTIGDVLTLPPLLLEKYLAAADEVARAAILDWKPVKLRVEAEESERQGSGGDSREGFNILWSNGQVGGQVTVQHAGEYVLRARAYGLQAGPDPARMALFVDGQRVTEVDVKETAAAPGTFEAKVTVGAGQRRLGASFTNDYWRPNAPEGQRDRNLAIDFIELEGPVAAPPLPWAHRTYVTKRPGPDAKPAQRKSVAKEVLGPLVSRAFRRPARPDELDRLARLVDVAMTEGDSFERGLQLALQATLCSTSFLYRPEGLEPAPKAVAEGKETRSVLLGEHELATRLSYFLWSSCPDDELLRHAAAGTLRANREAQVRRLLADPKARRLSAQFAVQWLQLRRLATAQPDPQQFPRFDEPLREAMLQESELLFDAIVRENRPVLELVDPPFAFLNEALAKHYGVPGVTGPEMRRVDRGALGGAPRGGVLAHASVLTATSNPTRTSPVKRGKWVLEVLLDDPPPPPVPGMDSLKDEGTPLAAKTLRERLEAHRSRAECAQCHQRMDPIGFGLERFDAVGAWRDTDGSHPIDDRATLPGGVQAQGLPALQAWLRERSRPVSRALARKLLVFGLGRGPVAADDAALEALLDRLGAEPRVQDIVVGLTGLDAFHRRRLGRDPAQVKPPQGGKR